MPTEPALHPCRRFLRFSVRGLIVVVLVIGAGLGWIVREAHIQRDAVAAIVKAGGRVGYDWDFSDAKPVPGRNRWAPKWLVDRVGVDYFSRVTKVSFVYRASVTDAQLAEVGRLTRLKELYVIWPFSFGTATELEQFTDAGLMCLDGLTNLKKLCLANIRITDFGLVKLKGRTNLTFLVLRGTRVTDAGLAHLKGLTKLVTLDLGLTRVTDAGLANLRGLTELSTLHLDGTQATDAGLVHLKWLTKLEYLDLARTHVTDAGLVRLTGLTKLTTLDLRDTPVTDAAIKELQHALPSLTIDH
jgi:Leucine-rich repeat (LRR) protein